jgi:hypothetical protein
MFSTKSCAETDDFDWRYRDRVVDLDLCSCRSTARKCSKG